MVISLWLLLAIISVAGALGGLVNGLLGNNGFLLPFTQEVGGQRIIRPGFLGNILIGMVASTLSWGLYGPLSTAPLFDTQSVANGFTLSALVGAILIGVAGARWISNEVDKKVLTLTTSLVPPDDSTRNKGTAIVPSDTLNSAQKLTQPQS